MDAALVPGTRIAGLVIERLLGAGGMGAVYLAHDPTLERPVALKLVTPALAHDARFRDRLLAESRLAARLEHPGIVPVYAAGEDDGRLYLAMRYVPGGTLGDRLVAGPLAVAEAAALLTPVADALDAAHAAGLVHRDVKPGNVLLDGSRGLLADFGLARRAASPDSLTRGEGFSGTTSYVAPEQIEGDAVDGRADQYALACVLFEAICGRPPFVRDAELALVHAHLADTPPSPSAVRAGLSPAVDAAILRGLAKRPGDRHASSAALVAAVAAGAVGAVDAPRSRRRAVVLAAAGAAVIAIGAALGIWAATRGGDGPAVGADQLVAIDAASGHVAGAVDLGVPPVAMAVDGDDVWVAAAGANTIVHVDRAKGTVTQTIPTDGPVNDLLVADGALWATVDLDRKLERIDPVSGVASATEIVNSPGAMVATPGAIWVTSRLDGTVSRIDPATGKVTRTIPIGLGVNALAAAFGSVWVTNESQSSVTRIDPVSGDVLDTVPVGHSPAALAATSDALWIANRGDGTVSRLDPARNAVTATVTAGRAPTAIAASGDGVVVGDGETGDVVRLDASGDRPRRLLGLRATPVRFVVAGHEVLVVTTGLPASHRGGTLVMADEEQGWMFDPAVTDDNPSTWVWDTLVRYRRAAGSAGFDLVPDLAEAIPTPVDAGRAFTFRVRRGIHYSSGEEVRPSDFVLAFDRLLRGTFTYPDGTKAPSYLRDGFATLAGASDCIASKPSCDVTKAVVADDAAGTVTFHLDAPDPSFLHRLAATAAAPVPPGTPAHPASGLVVPGTGPYLVATSDDHHVMFRRNPRFHVWSQAARPDGTADVIDWLTDVPWSDTADPPRSAQIAMVEAGKADAPFKAISPAATERLLRLYPSQVHLTPTSGGGAHGFWLRSDSGPFASVDVRRALNTAIDRTRFAGLAPYFSVPTCQAIGPGFPGYVPYCPYTTDGTARGAPDLARAQALVRKAGATGAITRIAVWSGLGPDDWQARWSGWERGVVKAMRAIGLRVDVHSFTPAQGRARDDFTAGSADIDLFLGGPEGTLDAGDVVSAATARCSPQRPPGTFCDAPIQALIDRDATLADGAERTRGWTAIDHHLVDEASWLPIANVVNVVFLSRRVGDYGYQPATGGSLWDLMAVR
jgi:YVTN family beta-propeller protein